MSANSSRFKSPVICPSDTDRTPAECDPQALTRVDMDAVVQKEQPVSGAGDPVPPDSRV
jgi:hypothetical protein